MVDINGTKTRQYVSACHRRMSGGWCGSGSCNGATERVPGGAICTGGLASEGVQVIWYCRQNV